MQDSLNSNSLTALEWQEQNVLYSLNFSTNSKNVSPIKYKIFWKKEERYEFNVKKSQMKMKNTIDKN